MTQDRDEAAFLARVKSTLDESEGRVDDITAARLRTLRREAVTVSSGAKRDVRSTPEGWTPGMAAINAHRARRRPAWLLPTAGLATAATVATLAVTLWSVPPAPTETLPLDDLALLSDTEALEFYEELDFYLWLEHEQPAG